MSTHSPKAGRPRLPVDPYLLAIVATVALAAAMPCRGDTAKLLGQIARLLIGLLFFLYGARLSPQAVWRGLAHWRLQALVVTGTFVLFPLLGLAARVLVPVVLTPELYLGILVLCALPSTVQSSIVFTSIAGGNVAAALCAASASSLIGMVATPLLIAVLLGSQGGLGGSSLTGIEAIVLQLLLPFLAGQAVRPWLGDRLSRNARLVGLIDRGSVLLIVYVASSAGVVGGMWQTLRLLDLAGVALASGTLLAFVLATLRFASRRLGFARQDEIVAVFSGGNKSLVVGIPMLNVLLPAEAAAAAVVPLILFHQIQIIACATLARRYARHPA